ncbi:TrpR YerC/YecD [Candidatus Saccharibacteria bacterium]|nr:MAG: TrpR YerC/YecD [Candidatus Saccharibacteria bacterium]
MKDIDNIWKEAFPDRLARELARIDDEDLMRAFLRDVMTEKEILEISARLRAAEMLRAGSTYTQIESETKLSSRTVARISEWLRQGTGGYSAVLDHAHLTPAPAD